VSLRRDDLERAAGAPVARRAERLARVEREIRQTQAEALGRVGERLESLLASVAAMDRALDSARRAGSAGDTVADAWQVQVEARNRLRDEALRVQQQLIIQREALGILRHAAVERCYPVPGRRPVPPAGDTGAGRTP
jgi:hypothetical protein